MNIYIYIYTYIHTYIYIQTCTHTERCLLVLICCLRVDFSMKTNSHVISGMQGLQCTLNKSRRSFVCSNSLRPCDAFDLFQHARPRLACHQSDAFDDEQSDTAPTNKICCRASSEQRPQTRSCTNKNILFVTRPRSLALLSLCAATDLVRGRCIARSTSHETKTFCLVASRSVYRIFLPKAFGNCIADIKDIHEKHFCCKPKLVRGGEHGCFIFIGHYPPKSPIISGSCAEIDLQASYGSWLPCKGMLPPLIPYSR